MIHRNKKITTFDIAVFVRQFATLISAGIPVIQCCDILEKCQSKSALRLLIYAIKRELLTGKNLFYSVQPHPQYFDELTCCFIQVGEQTGKLDTLLNTIADYHEKMHVLKQNIKQALFYPCIITITAIIATLGMFLFIIPRFAELFKETGAPLPWLTIWIFYLSAKLCEYLPFVMPFILSLLLLFRSSNYNTHLTHLFFQKIGSQLPILRHYLHKVTLARFTRLLALTISAGIPITHALHLASNVCTNPAFSYTIKQLSQKINAGLELHKAMSLLTPFPILMIQMVKIGEESGMLENMLNKFAELTETDIDHLLRRLNLLLEPLIMVVLGVLIGGLVMGMYLPIFKLGSVI